MTETGFNPSCVLVLLNTAEMLSDLCSLSMNIKTNNIEVLKSLGSMVGPNRLSNALVL